MQSFYDWLFADKVPEQDLPVARLAASILIYSILGVLVMFVVSFDNSSRVAQILIGLEIGFIISLGLIRLGYLNAVRYILPGIVWVGTSFVVYFVGDGTRDVGILGYPVVILFATLLGGRRGSIIFTFLSVASYMSVMYLEVIGVRDNVFGDRISLLNDGLIGTTLMIIIAMIQIALYRTLSSSLEIIRSNEQKLTQTVSELEDIRVNLEQKIGERTAQLRVSSEVGRVASSVLDPQLVIHRVVNLITNEFEYYYAAIFLTDPSGIWAELKDATGEGGQALLARNHRLQIGGQSMVGSAISSRTARIALDVGEEPVRFANPYLPDTRSEIALPLIAGNIVLGALDVQSVEEAAFSEEDIEILQNMANQVAVAIENARLFQESQTRLNEINRMFMGAFQSDVESATYSPEGLSLAGSQISFDDLTGLEDKEYNITSDGDMSTIAIPLRAGGQTLGLINLKTSKQEWTENELIIAQAVASQASSALENIRLLEQTQQRAQREQIISDITAKIRSTLNLDTVLKTATEEIRQSLDLTDVVIELGSPSTTEAGPSTNGKSESA